MESLETPNVDEYLSVRVAVSVKIRPLITLEILNQCEECIDVVPGKPQVLIGVKNESKSLFTFDYVYGSKASLPSALFDDCVAPLVETFFHGYNATVLAYGQSGSGKTYTMGTKYDDDGQGTSGGIIPEVIETIFKKVEQMRDSSEFFIRVSFIEIYNEKVFDLLDHKPVAPRAPIQIRETLSGGITLAGVNEAVVKTKEEMTSYLSQGSSSRATRSTNRNSQSSRSHAIFTITMEQKRSDNGEIADNYLSSKLHLVDLAGSERAKHTGVDGMQLQEGIHINKDLLALGNVISALGDKKKWKEGGFVPYRDSKLTRLLQDSLGGNSKTVLIACVSPTTTNFEETLNTLKYASRARSIQNKAVIICDPVADQLQKLHSQIEQLQTKLLFYKGDASGQHEEQQAEVKHFANSERSVLIQHQEKKILEAEHELIEEIQVLTNKIAGFPSACDDAAQKLKEEYSQNLKFLEAQVTELQKKQDAQSLLLRQNQKSDEAARRLQDEIERIKSLKVQLQHMIKQECEGFRLWKAEREKEVLQVLQKKTDEASMATKRLKELPGGGPGPGIEAFAAIPALKQAIEHEIEVVVQAHEVHSQHDRHWEEISGKERWNQVRSLADAKNLMNYLFDLASDSRCQLRDKDDKIKDLEEEIVRLNGALSRLEIQNAELDQGMDPPVQASYLNSGRRYCSCSRYSQCIRTCSCKQAGNCCEDRCGCHDLCKNRHT